MMKKKKFLLPVLMLIIVAGFSGCGSMTAHHRAIDWQPPVTSSQISQSPWWENGGIDIDWPY